MTRLDDVTGVVLAGGRGSRMGGVDKGLQLLDGRPLVQHAIERLAPQVGPLLINANRHLDAYAAFGLPVVSDAEADFAGPLAGMLAALQRCTTPWLVTVPCDTPHFPRDLVARLHAAALEQGAEVVMPVTTDASGTAQPQPVFLLLARELRAPLEAFLAGGERKIERFTAGRRELRLPFAGHEAFFNANTPGELERLRHRG